MKNLLTLLLKSQHQRKRSGLAQTEKGMTLIELLIGTVMAFLIITPMLGFVVDMLNTDRREQIKTNTEQDIQAATDFIAQDLSQAIYIYDNDTIYNAAPDGTVGIRAQLPNPVNGTPILVFWKREQIRNAVSVNTTTRVLPNACNANNCNDTYVRSLVAYYQINNPDPIWCQPLVNCPTRIARYEIKEGVRNPDSADPNQPYYDDTQANSGQQVSEGFNPNFNFRTPRLNVTLGNNAFPPSQVLVNYIDHSPLPAAQVPTGLQCQTLLGVTPPTGPGAPAFDPNDLLIKDTSANSAHSFYACVDTQKNLARVTIRGNSLRRLQPKDADYNANKSAFFPTATVQVQGLGARGK